MVFLKTQDVEMDAVKNEKLDKLYEETHYDQSSQLKFLKEFEGAEDQACWPEGVCLFFCWDSLRIFFYFQDHAAGRTMTLGTTLDDLSSPSEAESEELAILEV